MARPKIYKTKQLRTALHNIHREMLNQCYTPTAYNHDKNIRVNAEWMDFANFYKWAMENDFEIGKVLDRFDNAKDFVPSNCYFIAKGLKTKRKNKPLMVTYNNETKPAIVWARQYGVERNTFIRRLRRGWSVHNALTTPPRAYANVWRDNEMGEWEE